MCALILRADRDFPVVALTCRKGERGLALAVGRVREIIGRGVPLFVVAAGEVRTMKALLPKRHDVFDGAARVWWPGVNERSDPREHPLFFDASRRYGERVLEELAREFRVRSLQVVDRTPEQQAVLQERLRLKAEIRNSELTERLEEAERRAALYVAPRSVPRPMPGELDARAAAGNEDAELPGLSEALQIAMIQKWTETLQESFDWGEWPLVSYALSEDFLRSLKGRAGLDDVAWTCAMIACGLAKECKELAVERLAGPGGRQLIQEDDAIGWRCAFTRNTGTAHLDFWTYPSGSIEFSSFTMTSDRRRA